MKELAAMTGITAHITGHACRVTGAQSMAKAGVALWVVQGFCRWGSDAVLGYVRDLQLEAADYVAPRVGQALGSLKQRWADEFATNAPGMRRADVQAMIDQALEESLAKQVTWQGSAAALTKEMLDLEGLLEAARAAVTDGARKLVVNRLSARVHVARGPRTTWCGWPWAGHCAADVVTVMPAGAEWCAKCLSFAPAPEGGHRGA